MSESVGDDEGPRRPSLRTMDPPQSPQAQFGHSHNLPEYMGLDSYHYRPRDETISMVNGLDHDLSYHVQAPSLYPPPASHRSQSYSQSIDGISPGSGRKGPSPGDGQLKLFDPSHIGLLPQHPPGQVRRQSIRQRSATPSPKRRRLHLNPPLHAADPSSIVVADMQNESDALHILALASGQTESRDEEGTESKAHTSRGVSPEGDSRWNDQALHEAGDGRRSNRNGKGSAGKEGKVEDFALVKLGILSVDQIEEVTNTFFRYHHHLFVSFRARWIMLIDWQPMVPSSIIPRTSEDMGRFASDEPYLLTGIIIIASRNHQAQGMREIHERSWAVMRVCALMAR